MPITEELKSINRLEQAGFTPEQAKAIVEVQEAAIQRGFERFVEVLDHKLGEFELRINRQFQEIRQEMAGLRTDMADVRTDMANLRADLMREQRDQMLRFAALVSLIVAVAGTVFKLL
jgi:DNA-binding transcriptional MerR regulator